MTEKEAAGIDEGHVSKRNANASNGFSAEMTHEKRVGHIVEARHQHTDDGRDGHSQNQPFDGLLCHYLVFFVEFLFVKIRVHGLF